jgi:ABC-type glycerol-3-phosphate transport system substrate-binding protein
VLSVLAGQSTTDPGIEVMIDDLLRRRYPDIGLEWERVDWGEKFQSQMQAKFAAGEVPDIMIGKAQDIATYAPSGNLARIPPLLLARVKDTVIPAVSVAGIAYGIPYNAFYQGVLYNKDIFAAHGLKPPADRVQMSGLVRALTLEGITPFAAHFVEAWYTGNIVMQFALGEVFRESRDWGDRFRAGTVSFAGSAGFRGCFLTVRDILANSWPDALTIEQSEADERFAAGKAAMYVTGTWSLQAIDGEKPPLSVGIFPYPNNGGNADLIFEPNMTFMKSSKTAHADAVDGVLQIIFDSRELAAEILDFTKTSSMLRDVSLEVPLLVQQDIDRFQGAGRVVDATLGNTQLIWSFQERVAGKLNEWLWGKTDLQSVLEYADTNHAASAP